MKKKSLHAGYMVRVREDEEEKEEGFGAIEIVGRNEAVYNIRRGVIKMGGR